MNLPTVTLPVIDSIVELNYEQRSVFGECPVCHAWHGEKCDSSKGITLGYTPPNDGVHLGRLNKAPQKVFIKLL